MLKVCYLLIVKVDVQSLDMNTVWRILCRPKQIKHKYYVWIFVACISITEIENRNQGV